MKKQPEETDPLLQPTAYYSSDEEYETETTCCSLEALKLFNVIVMGLGFMMLFTAYNTTQNFATKLLGDEGFGNLGFYSLALLYIVVSVSVFFSPVIVPKTGERLAMWMGAICYIVYIASLVKIIPSVVYAASTVVGFGASILWVAQGAFLTKCSEESTRGRNSGIFWGLFQISGIVGNLGAYGILENNEPPSFLFIILSGCGGVGVLILLFLRPIVADLEENRVRSPWWLFKQSFNMFGRRDIILMLVLMFFSGFELSYFSGEFPLLMDPKLIGVVMTVFGAAEVIGGVVFGKLSDIVGRKAMVVTGLVVYCAALVLSWMGKFHSSEYNYYLWFIAAACLGLGDSLFNTQLYASLGTLFPEHEMVAAFTIFQLLQNLGSAAGFIISPYLPVHGNNGTMDLLIILAGCGLVGTLLFMFVNLKKEQLR